MPFLSGAACRTGSTGGRSRFLISGGLATGHPAFGALGDEGGKEQACRTGSGTMPQ